MRTKGSKFDTNIHFQYLSAKGLFRVFVLLEQHNNPSMVQMCTNHNINHNEQCTIRLEYCKQWINDQLSLNPTREYIM